MLWHVMSCSLFKVDFQENAWPYITDNRTVYNNRMRTSVPTDIPYIDNFYKSASGHCVG